MDYTVRKYDHNLQYNSQFGQCRLNQQATYKTSWRFIKPPIFDSIIVLITSMKQPSSTEKPGNTTHHYLIPPVCRQEAEVWAEFRGQSHRKSSATDRCLCRKTRRHLASHCASSALHLLKPPPTAWIYWDNIFWQPGVR